MIHNEVFLMKKSCEHLFLCSAEDSRLFLCYTDSFSSQDIVERLFLADISDSSLVRLHMSLFY